VTGWTSFNRSPRSDIDNQPISLSLARKVGQRLVAVFLSTTACV
jgi:hypothetical protein